MSSRLLGKNNAQTIILTSSIAQPNMNHTNRNDTTCKDLELARVENSDTCITKGDTIGTGY